MCGPPSTAGAVDRVHGGRCFVAAADGARCVDSHPARGGRRVGGGDWRDLAAEADAGGDAALQRGDIGNCGRSSCGKVGQEKHFLPVGSQQIGLGLALMMLRWHEPLVLQMEDCWQSASVPTTQTSPSREQRPTSAQRWLAAQAAALVAMQVQAWFVV